MSGAARGLALLAALASLACGQPKPTPQATALAGESPPDVFRSTLDGRPRALTARMGEGLWVAWDVERGALLAVFPGGVDLEGAVYTGQHGPQPAVRGPAWLRGHYPAPWQLRAGGRMQRAAVRHRGHTLPDDRGRPLTLAYDLRVEGAPAVGVREQVRRLEGPDGTPGIERRFALAPEGSIASLDLALGGLDPERDVDTDGRLEPRDTLRPGERAARLHLRPAGETRLVLWLRGEPSVAAPPPGTAEAPRGQVLVEQSDCLVCHGLDHATTGPALRDVAARYGGQGRGAAEALARKVREGGSGVWGTAVMTPHPDLSPEEIRAMIDWILALEGGTAPEADEPLPQRGFFSGWGEFFAGLWRRLSPANAPGDGLPLSGVHPGFDLETVRPAGFAPRVGGLDFLPDGRLVVTSWDPVGGVYLLDGLQGGGAELRVKRIAAGLAEPLGVRVVGGDIYVLQKPELTRLVDLDGDDVIDEYRTVSRPWPMTTNFHEFAFGLAYDDGFFYATLATAILPGGASAPDQLPERGRVVRIPRDDGPLAYPAFGLRTPNGIALAGDPPEQRLYVTDNQGDWLPSSKLVALSPGEQDVFFGSRAVLGEAVADRPVRPPVVWLPQGEIGNSPGEPVPLRAGPYRGQLLLTDVTHGGLKRVFVEEVAGVAQGAVFRFSQGFEAGIHRAVWGPHGRLYVGGIGSNGNWGQADKERFGLQRLTWNGTGTFEMKAVRARPDGLDVEWTAPVGGEPGPGAFRLRDWRYVPTAEYGGPKVDPRDLPVASVRWSEDRTRARLVVPGIAPGRVVHLRLDPDAVRGDGDTKLWTTEAWVTLNALPEEETGP